MRAISITMTRKKMERLLKSMPDGDFGWQRLIMGLDVFVSTLPRVNLASVEQLIQLRDELYGNDEITMEGLKRINALICTIEKGDNLDA